MNVIFIMNDTFHQDHLGCCGNTWIHTPNLGRRGRQSENRDGMRMIKLARPILQHWVAKERLQAGHLNGY